MATILIMAHLIEKDALVAEIENRKKKYTLLQQKSELSDLQEELQNKIDCLNSIKGYIINTLEVKEVDLEKEIKEDWLFADKTEVDCLECMCLTEGMFVSLAKKYFQLGLKAQKGKKL